MLYYFDYLLCNMVVSEFLFYDWIRWDQLELLSQFTNAQATNNSVSFTGVSGTPFRAISESIEMLLLTMKSSILPSQRN